MVFAFSEWWRNSIRERSVAGQAKARTEGRFPGRRPSLTEQQRKYIRVERSKGVSQRGTGQAPGGQSLDHPTGRRIGVGCNCSLGTEHGLLATWPSTSGGSAAAKFLHWSMLAHGGLSERHLTIQARGYLRENGYLRLSAVLN